MKKNKAKLELKTNTVRVLQGSDLKDVIGGEGTANCTAGPTCGSSMDACPHSAPCSHACGN